jgi:hypothetical protein
MSETLKMRMPRFRAGDMGRVIKKVTMSRHQDFITQLREVLAEGWCNEQAMYAFLAEMANALQDDQIGRGRISSEEIFAKHEYVVSVLSEIIKRSDADLAGFVGGLTTILQIERAFLNFSPN